MTDISDIPARAQQFLKTYIKSVWQLELIVFLKSSGKAWNCQDISKALYMSSDKNIETVLQNFERAGVVQSSQEPQKTYIYAPTNTEMRDSVEQALKAYSERRVQVVNLIYTAPMQYFSDAFKLREEDR